MFKGISLAYNTEVVYTAMVTVKRQHFAAPHDSIGLTAKVMPNIHNKLQDLTGSLSTKISSSP